MNLPRCSQERERLRGWHGDYDLSAFELLEQPATENPLHPFISLGSRGFFLAGTSPARGLPPVNRYAIMGTLDEVRLQN